MDEPYRLPAFLREDPRGFDRPLPDRGFYRNKEYHNYVKDLTLLLELSEDEVLTTEGQFREVIDSLFGPSKSSQPDLIFTKHTPLPFSCVPIPEIDAKFTFNLLQLIGCSLFCAILGALFMLVWVINRFINLGP